MLAFMRVGQTPLADETAGPRAGTGRTTRRSGERRESRENREERPKDKTGKG
jgi:hypothetical protein